MKIYWNLNHKKKVVPLRFERKTYCLEGSCSIQLSYETIVKTLQKLFALSG